MLRMRWARRQVRQPQRAAQGAHAMQAGVGHAVFFAQHALDVHRPPARVAIFLGVGLRLNPALETGDFFRRQRPRPAAARLIL